MKHIIAAAMLALGCLAPPAQAEVRPPKPQHATDAAHCDWVWREGRDLGLWTEACTFSNGRWDVAYDDATDSFSQRHNGADHIMALRQFREAGGPEALLATLKRDGLVRDDPECLMAPLAGRPSPAPQGWTAWQVMPTGALKQAFDKEVQEQVPAPPCGPLGYSADTVSFFMVKDDAPGRVFYVNLGQDGTMIDLASLRLE